MHGEGEMVMMRTDTSHMRPPDNAGVPCGMSSSLLMHTHTPTQMNACTQARNINTTTTLT